MWPKGVRRPMPHKNLDVESQEVVHSAQTEETEVAQTLAIQGGTEWTSAQAYETSDHRAHEPPRWSQAESDETQPALASGGASPAAWDTVLPVKLFRTAVQSS